MGTRITGTIRFGYAVGHIFNDLSNAVWLSYTLLFFTHVVEFEPQVSGYLMLLGQLIDAICTPGIGYISDSYNLIFFSKFGKRKSWYFLGTCITMGSLPLLYSECPGCSSSTTSQFVQFFYYCFIIILYQMGWAAVATVHLALVTELTYSAKERILLLALRNIFTTISNLAVHIVASVVLSVGKQISTDEGQFIKKKDIWKFQSIIIVVMIVGGLTSLIFFFSVQEAKLDKDQRTLVMMKTRKTIADILRQWQLYQIGCFYMCTRIYCSMMQCMVPLYILNSLKMDLLNIALVPLTMYTASLIASLLTGPLNERFGRKITFSFGAVLAGIASLWIEFHSDSPSFKTAYIFSVAVLYGSANSVMLVTALASTTDLVGSDTENGAFIFGIMTFLDKASCGILICIIQGLYNQDDINYYQKALAMSCGFSSFLAAVVVIAFPMEIVDPDAKGKKDKADRPTIHT